MKILCTGNRGFVGSETQKLLEKEGYQVIGYDLMLGQDIRDSQQLAEVVSHEKPNRILHLAAIARFADADKDPKLAHETNVIGTANVVYVAKKFHIPLVYSSTGSVYMPIEKEGQIKEDWPAKGNSVYGCTKYQGELYVREHTPYIILRYAHLLGAEKRHHGLVGGFLNRIERGLAPMLYGGAQSNSFTYIKDIARANLLALTAPWDSWNQIYNIGNKEELSTEEAGKMVCEVFNYKGEIEKKPARTVDPVRFWFDCQKAKEFLKFEAEYTLHEGLLDMKKEMNNANTM